MDYVSENSFRLGHYLFELDISANIRSRVSQEYHFILMKSRELVDDMAARFLLLKPRAIVEFGIQRGGSVAFFNQLLKPDLHIAFELHKPPIAALETFREAVAKDGRRLDLHYGVDQSDRAKVRELVMAGLQATGTTALDLVIDDASHLYAPSRASFEVVFPLLRSGGLYALEDWAWAHWPGYQQSDSPYAGGPALTNLVFQLTMLCGTHRDVLPQLVIAGGIAFAQRGAGKIEGDRFDIGERISMRNRELVLI